MGREHLAEVISKERRSEVFYEMHGSVIGGHPGETKTLHKIRQFYFWPGLADDVRNMVCYFDSSFLFQ